MASGSYFANANSNGNANNNGASNADGGVRPIINTHAMNRSDSLPSWVEDKGKQTWPLWVNFKAGTYLTTVIDIISPVRKERKGRAKPPCQSYVIKRYQQCKCPV